MFDSDKINWQIQPRAEQLLLSWLQDFQKRSTVLQTFEGQLLTATSTRMFDWIDHFILPLTDENLAALANAGFIFDPRGMVEHCYHHPGARLPHVLLRRLDGHDYPGVAMKVDHIAKFLQAQQTQALIEGSILSGYRRCLLGIRQDVSFWAVERRGTLSLEPITEDVFYLSQYLDYQEKFLKRPRNLPDEELALHKIQHLARTASEELSPAIAAHLFLESERIYWQSRNFAGQVQKGRQDRMGLGWSNHDHHTFRSSRKNFAALLRTLGLLGFERREHFYAGHEAGWGAQVMENPNSGHVLFVDVDLSPEEIQLDFVEEKLPDLPRLGTIGLWCRLHGDSMLQAGLHHLAILSDFDRLIRDLDTHQVHTMSPFSAFPYLKQAFTAGQIWHIKNERMTELLQNGLLEEKDAEKFRNGAIGSHLENIQRGQGFKGFNQKNVSKIIHETDPREVVI